MLHLEFVFLKLISMVFGLLVATAAYRAYTRYDSRPLLHVALGFVFISIGVGLEGFMFDFTPFTLHQASLVHSAFMILGMAFILYSIYGTSEANELVLGGEKT